MSKAILVMDMPTHCIDCPMRNDNDDCVVQSEVQNISAGTFEELRKTCPLRELPQKHTVHCTDTTHHRFAKDGWNHCINTILRGGAE